MEKQLVEIDIKELSKEIEEICLGKNGFIDIQEAIISFFEIKKKIKEETNV
jgi:hypothetical protein